VADLKAFGFSANRKFGAIRSIPANYGQGAVMFIGCAPVFEGNLVSKQLDKPDKPQPSSCR
jgi:hypothetical protein